MAISLAKGQQISLSKAAGGLLTRVVMGLGWDVVKKKGFLGFGGGSTEIDLDASCLMFDSSKTIVDSVWFGQLKSRDGSIVHTGDNLTGEGDGDDEQIIVDLSRVPANVQTLIFTVNSFTGQNFSQVENAFCRLVNATNEQEIARYNLSSQGQHTGQIMAKLYREGNDWQMVAIGAPASGKTFPEMMPLIQAHL